MKIYRKRILVTGGSGLVGSYLKRRISPDGNNSIVYMTSSDFDLCNVDEVYEMLGLYQPEIVIHLAARVGGIVENMAHPVDFFEQNVLMNTNLLKMCHKWKVKHVIAMLSTCAYPDVMDSYPMEEADLFNGRPPETNFSYAFAKRAMGAQIDAYVKEYNKKWCYLLPCNLYGEFDKFDGKRSHFVGALLNKIINATDTIELFGTGKPLRQFMYADDLAKLIELMIERNIYENMNVAPDMNYSIDDMAKLALIVTNNEHLKIVYNTYMPDGQYRKDVSPYKRLKLFPDFKLMSLGDGLLLTYKTLIKSGKLEK